MKKPWNLVNVPVYSISTIDNGIVNMNICTYVSAVSMSPKRYMVAIYHNTKTHAVAAQNQLFVLQLLSEKQYGLVKNFGQKSGISFDKHGFIQRKNALKLDSKENPYATYLWNGHSVLTNAVAVLLLKPIQIIPAGDHDMFLCDVLSYKNQNDNQILTLDTLRAKKLIRI